MVALQHLGVKRLAPALAVALQIRSHRGKRITASSDFIALQTERNRAAGFVFADLLRGRTLNQAYAETAKKLGISKSTARRAWKQNGSDWLPAATVQVVSGRGDASTRSVSPATLVERNRAHTSR
ncbi:MAG TPA: hypothetical protein VFA27_13080 [Vicinamibacterales bacterium]|nr:hypothetical protein [Vicinamibacterales bacterium]